MKISPTTLYGATAGTCLAAAQFHNVNPTVQLALELTAAVSIALLGRSAQDCPANCPGTDARGKPKRTQSILFLPVAVTAVLVLLSTLVSGCATKNTSPGAGTPGVPAYVVSPAFITASNTAAGVAEVIGPVTGTGGALPLAVNGLFALIGALSVAYARHKNEVATTLAAGITQAGPAAVSAVLTSAADSRKYAAVADALNQQLPAGQAPGAGPFQK